MLIHVAAILLYFVATVVAISRPPSIVVESDYNVFYKPGESVQLLCEAEGEPRPTYLWKRNGLYFKPSGNDARLAQLPNVGTIVFINPEDRDEGRFQCVASNSLGTSVSKKIYLRQAKLQNFTYAKPTRHYPKLGEPWTLPCVAPESVPPARVFWINKLDNGGVDVYNYNDRVSVDREFRLRFTNIKREDFKDGVPYACVSMNKIMRKISYGPLHYINPIGTTEDYRSVQYLWSDQDDRFGLRGESFSVKCIFSGNPTPDVRWERTDNKSLPDRVTTGRFSQELTIDNLQFEDAGPYECWATNAISGLRQYRTFNIRVNSKPYFIDEPQDIEIGVGANVEFNCMAGGVPDPDIEWFINDVPLKDVTDERIKSPRFKHPLKNKIYLENVQLGDHMVIQCNASNVHGYVFSDVYLNVVSQIAP